MAGACQGARHPGSPAPHVSARGTTNRNDRGSAETRRRRKQFLLDRDGDGTTAACAIRHDDRCLVTVTLETMQVDRVQPGCKGGTYRRDNIRVACGPCNSRDGSATREALKRERGGIVPLPVVDTH